MTPDIVTEARQPGESVGLDYCTLHHGIRNEDDHWCDFHDDDPEEGPDGEPRECVLVPLILATDLTELVAEVEGRSYHAMTCNTPMVPVTLIERAVRRRNRR